MRSDIGPSWLGEYGGHVVFLVAEPNRGLPHLGDHSVRDVCRRYGPSIGDQRRLAEVADTAYRWETPGELAVPAVIAIVASDDTPGWRALPQSRARREEHAESNAAIGPSRKCT